MGWHRPKCYVPGRGRATSADVSLRFKVSDIESERERILRDARPPDATAIKRFDGLVAVCDFLDPWGNAFGLYQVLFEGTEPPKLSGSNREHMTDVERLLAEGGRRVP